MGKIYTRTGDKGTTALLSGKRVPKYDMRLDVYGTVDELLSLIGVIRSLPGETFSGFSSKLLRIQSELMLLSSIFAADDEKARGMVPDLPEDSISLLEEDIDHMTAAMPPLRAFIVPGGSTKAAFLHLARTVCRRAERKAVELAENAEVPEYAVKYLNRLSDWLFVAARFANFKTGTKETEWSTEFLKTYNNPRGNDT